METKYLSENLRRLREARRLTQDETAQRAGISVLSYRNIEMGKNEPRLETLTAISNAFEVDVFDLFKPVLILNAVRFRAQKKLRTRNEILSEVAVWLQNYRELEALLDKMPISNSLSELSSELSAHESSEQRAKEAAKKVRELWGLNDSEPIRNICGLFMKHDVKVLSYPKKTEGFFGLSVGSDDGGPAVVVNTWSRIPVERWIFSAAHELGHLILHKESYDVQEADEKDAEENEASYFAAQFLMPDEALFEELKYLRGMPLIQIVIGLKGIFKVSWKTVVKRLVNHRILDNSAWPRLYGDFKKHGYDLKGHREPLPLGTEDYVAASGLEVEKLRPNYFLASQIESLVYEALQKEKITVSKAAKILNKSVADMRSLARDWIDNRVYS